MSHSGPKVFALIRTVDCVIYFQPGTKRPIRPTKLRQPLKKRSESMTARYRNGKSC